MGPFHGSVIAVRSVLGASVEAKTLVKSLAGNLVIPFRIKTGNRGGHNQLILSLLWTKFLSSEIADNFKVAIIGHLHRTDFDRNNRPIFSL